MDLPVYFGIPFLIWAWARKMIHQPFLYEVAFPAHPLVIEERRKVMNKCCFFAPEMLKNEIEFMHSKIDGVKTKEDLANKIAEENEKHADIKSMKYEKSFTTGDVGLSLFRSTTQEDEAKAVGKRFKVIVDHGELYLECVDTFEEIFEIDKKLVQDVELTNILDPYLFSNHRDIINALFEVYYDLG